MTWRETSLNHGLGPSTAGASVTLSLSWSCLSAPGQKVVFNSAPVGSWHELWGLSKDDRSQSN